MFKVGSMVMVYQGFETFMGKILKVSYLSDKMLVETDTDKCMLVDFDCVETV